MADLDISNPLVVIAGFFALFFTSIMVIVRIGMVGVINPIGGVIAGLLLGGVWLKTFMEK